MDNDNIELNNTNIINNNINLTKSEYNKEWYKENKDKHLTKLKEKIDCNICGIKIIKSSQYRHNISKKHINNISIYNKIHNLIENSNNI